MYKVVARLTAEMAESSGPNDLYKEVEFLRKCTTILALHSMTGLVVSFR